MMGCCFGLSGDLRMKCDISNQADKDLGALWGISSMPVD